MQLLHSIAHTLIHTMHLALTHTSLKFRDGLPPAQTTVGLAAALLCLHFGCGKDSGNNTSNSNGKTVCRLEAKATPAAGLTMLMEAEDSAKLRLEGEVYYDTQIKPLLAENCTISGCHDGNKPPNLNTYQFAKTEIANILSSVKAGRMPKSPLLPLDEKQIALLESWQAASTPQKPSIVNPATAGGATLPLPSIVPAVPKVDTATNSIKCGENTEVLDLSKFLSHPLMKRDQVATCLREGLIFDRNEKVCSKAKVATSYKCTRQGLIEAFDATPTSIRKVLDEAMGSESDPNDFGQFYSIDQCGEIEVGNPVAYLVRLVEIDKVVQLQVKELKVTDK